MACGSGCCNPPSSTPPTRPSPSSTAIATGAPSLTPQPYSDADNNRNTGAESALDSTDSCPGICCPTPAGDVPLEPTKAPTCCESKSALCCDSSCIDRLALRHCAGECAKPDTFSDCTRAENGVPCRSHIRDAHERYKARLEAVGCICRALLALGQESCCEPEKQSLLPKSCPTPRKSIRSADSVDSCCVPTATRTEACADFRSAPAAERDSCTTSTGADARCSDTELPSYNENTYREDGNLHVDDCCREQPVDMIQRVHSGDLDVGLLVDLEQSSMGLEHVILGISGMTCTGCETKLSRTLATLPSIQKLKTSLVLSRAEFELDTSIHSASDIMKHLERTTEFKCERVTNQGSSIDLICASNTTEVVKGDWPSGVIEVRVVDRNTIRVDFDPKVIGARDLVQKGWPNPMRLAPPRADPTLDAGAQHVRHVGYRTLLSILLTIPVLVLAWAPLPGKHRKEITFGSISLAFATVVQFVVAGPFYPKALKALVFSRIVEMDLLIVLSTSAAYIFSVVAFGYLVSHDPLSTGEFFETSTLLVTLIMVGRFVAAFARQKAVESISIRSLQSSFATLVNPDNIDKEEEIDSRLLQFGDIFKVGPDSRIPTDGTVISGASEIDESMITGESRPVEKSKGSLVIAGSINGSGVLIVRLTRIPGDNTISTIASMVDDAKLSKPKVQEIADRVASYFVPVVIAITVIVFCIWIAVGIAVQNKSASEATIQAITYAITVLIVSCPCAIGLAVPVVIVVATGVAADRGVIFKSADAIEIARKTAHVVFDKTGTLTQGKLTVVRNEFSDSSINAKALLLGLIDSNKHPISVAVASHLRNEGVVAATVSDQRNVVSKGVEGTSAGRTLRAGNSRWLGVSDNAIVQSVLSRGYTVFCFVVDGELSAVFGLEDSLREDAFRTICELQENGVKVHVLSGDDDGAVRRVAAELRIPASHVKSRCTPADKRDYIKELLATPDTRRSNKKDGKAFVMFCGDGTNDAVALAQASIGVHMNEGTDVAKSAADIVLMRPNLAGILVAITVSRRSIHRIVFNFGWSFVYNVFAILLAAGVFVHARIPPEFAGLGELVSVLPVIAAALLLKWETI